MQQFLEDEGWACRLPGLVLANQVRLLWVSKPASLRWKSRPALLVKVRFIQAHSFSSPTALLHTAWLAALLHTHQRCFAAFLPDRPHMFVRHKDMQILSSASMSMVQVFWGVSPVGPYNLNRSGAPAERIQRVRCTFLARSS